MELSRSQQKKCTLQDVVLTHEEELIVDMKIRGSFG